MKTLEKLKAQKDMAGEHKDWWHELWLNNAQIFPFFKAVFCFGDSMSQYVGNMIVFWKQRLLYNLDTEDKIVGKIMASVSELGTVCKICMVPC